MKNFILMACALAALSAAPIHAEQDAVATAVVEAGAYGGTAVGNRDNVLKYEGYQFGKGWDNKGVAGKVGVEGGTEEGYFGLNADFRNGYDGDAGYVLGMGPLMRFSGEFSSMMRRSPFMLNGFMLNDNYRTNQVMLDAGAFYGDYWYRRATYDSQNRISLPFKNPITLFFDYWREQQNGEQTTRYNSNYAGYANMDQTTEDFTVGAQAEVGKDAGVVYEHTYRLATDDGAPYNYGTKPDRPRKPDYQDLRANTDELKFRCKPSDKMAFTGSASAHQRNNNYNAFRARAYTGALSGAFYPTKSLSMNVNLLSRGTVIREDKDARSLVGPDASHGFPLGQGNDSQVDKNTFRGEFTTRYHNGHFRLKGGYMGEYNQRRGAPTEVFVGSGTYNTGYVNVTNLQQNALMAQDTKHVFSAGLGFELAELVEVEAGAKKMYANRPVMESEPKTRDNVNVSVAMPLPMEMHAYSQVDYTEEHNDEASLGRRGSHENTYLVGLGWAHKVVALGLDFSHENSRVFAPGYWGWTSGDRSGNQYVANTNIHNPEMNYRNKNDLLSGTARVKLPKGFVLTGRGAYGRSTTEVPVSIPRAIMKDNTAQTTRPVDYLPGTVSDLGPSDVRITRLGAGVEYRPEKNQDVSMRLGYRMDRWTDKYNDINSGMVNIAEAALSAKF